MRFSGYAIVSVSLAMQDLGDAFSHLATLGRENDRMRPVRTRTRRHQPHPWLPVANVEQDARHHALGATLDAGAFSVVVQRQALLFDYQHKAYDLGCRDFASKLLQEHLVDLAHCSPVASALFADCHVSPAFRDFDQFTKNIGECLGRLWIKGSRTTCASVSEHVLCKDQPH